jgi:hypothetical protein
VVARALRGTTAARKAFGGGFQVGPPLGHGGEHLLEVATGEPGLNGPGESLHHPPQPVEGGIEVSPAREPPQGDGVEAGVGKALALGPYSCQSHEPQADMRSPRRTCEA